MSNRQKALITAVIFLVFSTPVFAGTINEIKARDITGKFLQLKPRPLDTELGETIDSIQPVYDSNGVILYYAVYLEPAGIVFVAPDDEIEPIIAFTDSSDFDPYADRPLAVLLRNDMAGRLEAIEEIRKSDDEKIKKYNNKVKEKWLRIDLADRVMGSSVGIDLSSIDDVRVEPLILSKWSQSSECGEYCYNYYTPNHYVSGCTATSFAQVLRYFEYPTFGVGTPTFQIHIDGDPCDYSLRGGDGFGGSYDWSNMTLDPGCSTTETERQAIGTLLHDCGVSVEMSYTSSASSASNFDASERLKDTFGFDNSIYCATSAFIMDDLMEMMNPNLDAALPVILSIWGNGGHSVIADGYGYDMGTLYHHINMGWGGSSDAWYNLPYVGTSYNFDEVYACVYNIFINGSGEIISGRVTSGDLPVAGATITATASGAGPFVTTTNGKGIYALTNVNSNKLYTVTASYPGMGFLPQTASVGQSVDWNLNAGNVWGVDFENVLPSPPVASDGFAETDQDTPVVITLEAIDEFLPDPPGELTYIIQSLPVHGELADADTLQLVESVPYELAGDQVFYKPCIYHEGGDLFTFAADDGGTPPDGGLSNIATVTISVEPVSTLQTLLEADFEGGIPAGWTVVDGYIDGKTWTTDDPGGRAPLAYLTGSFCIVDSDWAGHVDMDEELITPVIDCSSASDVTLKFSYYFSYYSGEIGDVDVSIDYGPWQNVLRYTGGSTTANITKDISSIADGQSNVCVRWHYYNANYEWYWGIDNVEITGTVSNEPMVGDFNINCCVDTVDLEMLIGDWLTESGQPGWDETCNLYDDNIINAADFALFAMNWLEIQE